MLFFFTIGGSLGLTIYTSISYQGSFAKWESMGVPPEAAVQILALDHVLTESGQIYQHYNDEGCVNCWRPVDAAPEIPEIPDSLWVGEDCHYGPSTKGFVDALAVCEHWGPGVSWRIQAIRLDGQVVTTSGRYGELDEMMNQISYFFGAIGGCVLGMVVVLFLVLFGLLKKLDG
jgi:hypothetical protein